MKIAPRWAGWICWTSLAVGISQASDSQVLFESAREKQLQRKPGEAIELYRKVIDRSRVDLELSAPALVHLVECFQLLKGDSKAEAEYKRLGAKYIVASPPLDGSTNLDLEKAKEDLLWKVWDVRINLDAKGKKASEVAVELSRETGVELAFSVDAYLKSGEEEFEKITRSGNFPADQKELLKVKKAQFDTLVKKMKSLPQEDPTVELHLANAAPDEALRAFAEKAGMYWVIHGKDKAYLFSRKAAMLIQIFSSWSEPGAEELSEKEAGEQMEKYNEQQLAFLRFEKKPGNLQRCSVSVSGAQRTSTIVNGKRNTIMAVTLNLANDPDMRISGGEIYEVAVSDAEGKDLIPEQGYVHTAEGLKRQPKWPFHIWGHGGQVSLQFNTLPPGLEKLNSIRGKFSVTQVKDREFLELPLKQEASVKAGADEISVKSITHNEGVTNIEIVLKKAEGPAGQASSSSSSSSGMGGLDDHPLWIKDTNGERINPNRAGSSGRGQTTTYSLTFGKIDPNAKLIYTLVKSTSTREFPFEVKDVEIK